MLTAAADVCLMSSTQFVLMTLAAAPVCVQPYYRVAMVALCLQVAGPPVVQVGPPCWNFVFFNMEGSASVWKCCKRAIGEIAPGLVMYMFSTQPPDEWNASTLWVIAHAPLRNNSDDVERLLREGDKSVQISFCTMSNIMMEGLHQFFSFDNATNTWKTTHGPVLCSAVPR